MADLPAKPSLDHLRRQARDLLRAARVLAAGGGSCIATLTASGRVRTRNRSRERIGWRISPSSVQQRRSCW